MSRFECSRCFKSFASKQSVQKHLVKKNRCIQVSRCPRCACIFRGSTDLNRHLSKLLPCSANKEHDKLKIEQDKLNQKQVKLELEKRRLDLLEKAETRRTEQHINIVRNTNTTTNTNCNNNIFILTPPGPEVKPFVKKTTDEIIQMFNEKSFDEFSRLVGGPESSKKHKISSLIGCAHNNDELPQFKNIKCVDGKYYISKPSASELNKWAEISYEEAKDIIIYMLISVLTTRKAECFQKSSHGIDGPNKELKMRFPLETCIEDLRPEKNFKKWDTEFKNTLDTSIKPEVGPAEYAPHENLIEQNSS